MTTFLSRSGRRAVGCCMAGGGASLASAKTVSDGDGSTGSATEVHGEKRVGPLLTFLITRWDDFILILFFFFSRNRSWSGLFLVLLGGSSVRILLWSNRDESRISLSYWIFLVGIVRLNFVLKRDIGSEQS